jgi:hypothetical protein
MGDNSKRRRIQIVDGDDDVIDAPVRIFDDRIRRIEEYDDDDDNGSNPDELLNEEIESEGEGEDLMGENWQDDYADAPELDSYDSSVLARDDEPEIFESYRKRMSDRRDADEALDQLDALAARRRADDDYRDDELESAKDEDEELDEDLEDDEDDVDDVSIILIFII